jgi:calcineurin-like phosphoesterase family protein
VGLGMVAFAATLILLAGFANLIRPKGGAGIGPSTAAASASPSPLTATPSGGSASPAPSASASSSPAPSTSAAASEVVAPTPTPPVDAVLVGAGDIADCGLTDDSATAALVVGIEGTVFTAGDNAYPGGSAAQFRDCYDPTWGAFRDRTRPAAGNHDWETKDLAGYLGYFGTAAAPDGTSWYSYALGAWHVIVLDSDCSNVGGCRPDSPQGRWLSADLTASSATCTLAIWHHPRFSSGEHGNDRDVAPFWRALYDAGADVVINGHDHDYERFAPQDPDARLDQARGIREFVVGTGGAALRTFPTAAANSQLRAAVSHGVIRLDLHRSSFEWTFLPTSGDLSDSGSAPCH